MLPTSSSTSARLRANSVLFLLQKRFQPNVLLFARPSYRYISCAIFQPHLPKVLRSLCCLEFCSANLTLGSSNELPLQFSAGFCQTKPLTVLRSPQILIFFCETSLLQYRTSSSKSATTPPSSFFLRNQALATVLRT